AGSRPSRWPCGTPRAPRATRPWAMPTPPPRRRGSRPTRCGGWPGPPPPPCWTPSAPWWGRGAPASGRGGGPGKATGGGGGATPRERLGGAATRGGWGAPRRGEVLGRAARRRALVGTPFGPAAPAPAWRPPAVASLAEAAYQERLMPEGELDPTQTAVLA